MNIRSAVCVYAPLGRQRIASLRSWPDWTAPSRKRPPAGCSPRDDYVDDTRRGRGADCRLAPGDPGDAAAFDADFQGLCIPSRQDARIRRGGECLAAALRTRKIDHRQGGDPAGLRSDLPGWSAINSAFCRRQFNAEASAYPLPRHPQPSSSDGAFLRWHAWISILLSSPAAAP